MSEGMNDREKRRLQKEEKRWQAFMAHEAERERLCKADGYDLRSIGVTRKILIFLKEAPFGCFPIGGGLIAAVIILLLESCRL